MNNRTMDNIEAEYMKLSFVCEYIDGRYDVNPQIHKFELEGGDSIETCKQWSVIFSYLNDYALELIKKKNDDKHILIKPVIEAKINCILNFLKKYEKLKSTVEEVAYDNL